MLEFIYDYKNDTRYRKSFCELAKMIFDIDFEMWYARGFWNDNYVCYSYADGAQVVANVSVNKMKLILNGTHEKAIQIGTVMTHPGYEKRGLARDLMNRVLANYAAEYDIFYLMAHDAVTGFYPKFGFKPLDQKNFWWALNRPVSAPGTGRILDVSNDADIEIVFKTYAKRIPVSNVWGVEGAEHILLFHALHGFETSFYYVESERVIVVYQQQGDTIHLFDVIAHAKLGLADVLHLIHLDQARRVVLHFTPDLLDVEAISEPLQGEGVMFVKSCRPLVTPDFRHPKIAEA